MNKSLSNKILFLLVVFLIILNIFGYQMVKSYSKSIASSRLELATLDIKASIENKINANSRALYGAAAFFASSEKVTADQWATYIDHLDPRRNFPAVQTFAFSKIVKPGEISNYNDELAKRKLPNTKIFPTTDTSSIAVIHYPAPVTDTALKAVGFNMFSEPKRRAAMEYARDNNSIAITDKLVLVVDKEEKNPQSSLVLVYPVYKKNSDISTVEARRENIEGFVSFSIKMDTLMKDLTLNAAPALDFQIFDNSGEGSFTESSLLYNSGGSELLLAGYSPNYSSKSTIIFPNTNWYLRFTAIPDSQFGKIFTFAPYIIALGNILLSILLFLLIRKLLEMYFAKNQLSLSYAKKLIYEDAVVDDSTEAIIMTNEIGKITVFNKKAEQILGYKELDVINNMDFLNLILKTDLQQKIESTHRRTGINIRNDFDAVITNCLIDGKEDARWNLLKKDGHSIRLDMSIKPVYDTKNQLLGYIFTF